MLVLDRQSAATAQSRGSSNPADGASRVQLRLRADGQLVELPPGKTTIGSSPRCNVRIQQPGVQPVHCLIVHGPEGLTVRSWARDTRLNGVSFVESSLGLGDCLSLGPIELEVIDPQAPVTTEPEKQQLAEELASDSRPNDGRELARARGRKLLATLRQERSIQDDLRQQVSDLQAEAGEANVERDNHGRKLESVLAELDAARRQLEDQQSRNDSVNAAHEQLVEQLAEQQSRNDALNTKCEKLTARNEELEVELGQLSARVEQLTHEHAATAKDRGALADDHAGMCEQHRKLVEEKAQLQDEVGQLTSQFTNQHAAICGERDELRRQNEQLLAETRALGAERTAIAEERTALCKERNDLRQCTEELQTQLTQLHDESSNIAAAKQTILQQRDSLSTQNEQLQARISELGNENASLAASRAALSDERAQLQNENRRLVELERELQAAVAGRESTSEELYRALLQIAELQEREEQNKALVEVYETLSNERDQLARQVDLLKEQIHRHDEERSATENAWKSLSDEAAALSEGKQELADENARLLARLNEATEQLENARRKHPALEEASAGLERERTARAHAEAALTSAVAEGERRFAEQAAQFEASILELEHRLEQGSTARMDDAIAEVAAEAERKFAEQSEQFEDSVRALEQRLAKAEASREMLERVRDEAQYQQEEAEKQAAAQSRRISELESQLAAAEDRARELSNRPAVASASTWHEKQSTAELQPAPKRNELFDAGSDVIESQTPAEIDWSVRRDSIAQPSESSDISVVSPAQDAAPPAVNVWGSNSSDDQSGATASSKWDESAAAKGLYGDDGLFATEASEPSDNATPWGSASPANSPEDSPAGDDAFGAAGVPVAPKLPAASPAMQGPALRESSVRQSAVNEPFWSDPKTVTKHESTSYIERFAHMFTDDEPAQEEKTRSAAQPTHSGDVSGMKPRTMGIVRSEAESASPKNDDEESIEQYMAKLLNRVRGDSAGNTSSVVQPPSVPLNTPDVQSQINAHIRTAPLPIPAAEPAEARDATEATQSGERPEILESIKRKAAAAAPATDLGALRALANETARRAISRHELRKHRRNAVTKVIVSTLAGVTSLWMMLDSPDWKDIQFITACVSLLVAAIWAGETYRTFLATLKIAATDRPEGDQVEAEPIQSPGLPIDVEKRV